MKKTKTQKYEKDKNTKMQNTQKCKKGETEALQNNKSLGGVHGEPGFPVRKLINALNYLEN